MLPDRSHKVEPPVDDEEHDDDHVEVDEEIEKAADGFVVPQGKRGEKMNHRSRDNVGETHDYLVFDEEVVPGDRALFNDWVDDRVDQALGEKVCQQRDNEKTQPGHHPARDLRDPGVDILFEQPVVDR